MSPLIHLTYALLVAGMASASPSPTLSQQSCFEGTSLVCYGVSGGQSQNVDVEDVQYAADLLRYEGQSADPPGFWTFPAKPRSVGCDEWTVLTTGTVMVLAKHTDNAINSSVLLEDIATTIDGGATATAQDQQKAIIGCAAHGGQLVVKVDTKNPAYGSDAYKASGDLVDDVVFWYDNV
ncbi:hypothetical protein DL546_008112 [Coniochaeta pulveracea]|uniref:Ecp2 effector protein domain-containing protein n=1 Tax=Coniochaeta pulveracea TaxID=177199 RepID=A0A420YIX6_9PEZI|nr:hypothetical protein DL546_008112 [Coniochaeta pulveracea]